MNAGSNHSATALLAIANRGRGSFPFMSGFDWNVTAVSASAGIAALVTVVVALSRRRRRQTTTRADQLGEGRIEILAIDDAKSTPEQKTHPDPGSATSTSARDGALDQ